MPYRILDASHIVETLCNLERRIDERFPGAGLAAICRELVGVAGETQERAASIAKPNLALRAVIYLTILAGLIGLVVVVMSVHVQVGSAEIFSVFQGVEAAVNIVVLAGAALFFAITFETRIKRRRSLKDLHVFRSIAHVIDMHQLTKDPSMTLSSAISTASSPARTISNFELTRYLDYCSEMLSLTSKLAALYAQNLPDAVVIEAVNDIERLTTSLSSKIWQKITILDARGL
jgi:hypothetical protein